MDPWLVAVVTFFGTLVFVALLAIGAAGGLARFRESRQLSRRWLSDEVFRHKIAALDTPPKPVKPTAEPLWLLAVLQREGRLLDFLLEEIEGYQNDQIGAAVRDIHRGCHKAIKDHLVLEPVMKNSEGDAVEVAPGFDPSVIRMTGNVSGQPPFKGTLRHHGWRVKEMKLAKPPEGQDQFVVQPAEVEVA